MIDMTPKPDDADDTEVGPWVVVAVLGELGLFILGLMWILRTT